jgi:predicted transcriptional regulator
MPSTQTLGDQELAVLRHIAEAGSATVGEVADSFGADRGLARSTVLTMMERLRQKGFLSRRRVEGVYRYASRATAADVLRNAVRGFVERTLDGSVSPVVAYLAEREEVSPDELAELEDLVSRLQARARER